MKKILALLLALALLFGMAACGKESASEKGSDPAAENNAGAASNAENNTPEQEGQQGVIDEDPVTQREIDLGLIRIAHYKWRIIVRDGNKALVMSDIPVNKPYHESDEDVTWETCSLRAYLNGEFISENFSSKEQAAIIEITNKNPDNAQYGTPGGNDTKDKLFLLSVDEAREYFASDEERNEISGYWYLRSPGNSSKNAAYVDKGRVYVNVGVTHTNVDVYPVMWVDMDKLQ